MKFKNISPIFFFITSLMLVAGTNPMPDNTPPKTQVIGQLDHHIFERTGKAYQIRKEDDKQSEHTHLIVILKGDPLSKQMRKIRNKNLTQTQYKATVRSQMTQQKARRNQLVQELKATRVDVEVTREFTYLLNGMSVKIRKDQAQELRNHPLVASVHRVQKIKAFLDESVAQTGAPAVWDRMDPSGKPVLGQGMVVAVIDSGVDYTHPDLGGGLGPQFKVIGGYDFVDDDEDPMARNSHGTHVAGIIAAKGEITGMAPEASLLAYRVLDDYGFGLSPDIIAAIERAVDPDQDPLTNDSADVINMSLGGSGDASDPLSMAADEAVEAGVLVVVAAGNSGEDLGALGSPAASRKALTVGAIDKEGTIADFSSRGPGSPFNLKPEISAPGVSIRSTVPGGDYAAFNGTSMASPHVAGAAALMRQLYPDQEPEEIIKRLIQSATPIADTEAMAQGAGMLNLENALNQSLAFNVRTLSFGRVDSAQDEWSSQRLISLVNNSDSPQTVQLSLSHSLPEGVQLSVDKNNAELLPGQSVSLTVSVNFDNEVAPYPENSSLTFDGLLEARVGEQKHILPMVVRKSLKLDLKLSEQGLFYVYWDQDVEPVAGLSADDFSLHLKPGTYTMMGISDLLNNESTTFVQEENLTVSQDATLDLRNREQYSITQSWTDALGEVHAIDENDRVVSRQTFAFKSGGFFIFYDRNGPPLNVKTTQHSDAFQVENITVKHIGDRQFLEAGYKFSGISQDMEFNTQIAQNKKMTFRVSASDDPESFYSSRYTLDNPNYFYSTNLDPWSLIKEDHGKPPFQFTFFTIPQPEDPANETFTHTQRQFSFSTFDNYWFSPIIQVNDTANWTNIESQETFETASINFNQGPVIPRGRFTNDSSRIFCELTTKGMSGSTNYKYNTPYEITMRDGQTLQSEDLYFFEDIDPDETGEISVKWTFSNRLDGQAVPSSCAVWFDPSREIPNPPMLEYLRLFKNGQITNRMPDQLSLLVQDGSDPYGFEDTPPPIDNLTVFWRTDGDWTELEGDITDNIFSASVPQLDPGHTVDLKITAINAAGNRLECILNKAWKTGVTQVIPWVVNNDQWRSRVAIHNTLSKPVRAWLTGVASTGERQSAAITVQANGLYAADSADLFGDLTGYSLEIESESRLETSFLTFNTGPQSGGNSPSLTTGANLQELNQRLIFPYLPGDQIPAVVLSAPDQEPTIEAPQPETEVLLTLNPHRYFEPSPTAVITLKKDQPQAWLVSDLFPDEDLSKGVSLSAESYGGIKLAGSIFSFNHSREPSMAKPLSLDNERPTSQIVPWVVNNEQWQSRIAIASEGVFPLVAKFRAVTTSGDQYFEEKELEFNAVTVFQAEDLFPHITGYSLFFHAEPVQDLFVDTAQISASFMTFNKEAASGGNSPSQTTATQPSEPASTLVFSYLPGDQISALALLAPESAGETEVTLTLHNAGGAILSEKTIALTQDHPKALLLSDLFSNAAIPRDASVHAVSANGQPIAGTAFVFNNQREPSMAKPVAIKQ